MTLSECVGCKHLVYQYVEDRESMYYCCEVEGNIIPMVRACPGRIERSVQGVGD